MLHYRLYETDPSYSWVTFIHGAGGSSSIWYKQIKEYKNHFNILCIDLRGHGKSKKDTWKKNDTFIQVAEDVIKVLDHLNISSSHFVGISLGTIVIQTLAQEYPNRVLSTILGGAVIKLNIRAKFLLTVGRLFKSIIPYMWLYKLFATIIMPYSHHKESRIVFIQQAKKMCQKEFVRWFSLTKSINPFLKNLQLNVKGIPTLFIMGEEDYLFLAPVKELVSRQPELHLITLKNSGHVCNIDQPQKFNKATIQFIQSLNY
ncbi:alpha/beta hydrolase [Bacillus aquiflavi]|uniref:Alpha/beta hydrolase n=1 Tax=Bacillus aquiflavi TaxID=2672567 RepID=A0A6B3W6E8_9BACI|nr:alpha/beta hydrolase [Bacillus aquiflavi]MBA4538633.1 alpha/beta hydrolase [Bacillus aquiflavi]NEY82994.1 alpha/beta hydrolase [Bacillus aquiflavi]UAC47882.1 alpha/beta hydrolase [Bacillus aquiflavi]